MLLCFETLRILQKKSYNLFHDIERLFFMLQIDGHNNYKLNFCTMIWEGSGNTEGEKEKK